MGCKKFDVTNSNTALIGGFRRFRQEEAGSLTILSLMLAMLMILMGGIAVDLMRYESRRTALQNTLDRSTLAAASLTQTRDPRAVVDDYFLKAGLSEYLTAVNVDQGLNYREVSATALADTAPLFLGMMGIEEFDAAGDSTAEQRVNNVEVMLVLDVSGSMNSNSRLANLKTAANEFVQTVLAKDVEQKISIGIVPFNGQVNLGPTLRSQFNAVYPHGAVNVNCVDLPAAAYDNASLAEYAFATSVTPLALPMTADADTYSGTWQGNGYVSYTDTNYAIPNAANKWCPAIQADPVVGNPNIVRLPSQSIGQLQGYVTGLTAIGATSINAGMKWGLAMLAPEARPTYDSLIAGGSMSANLSQRPFDYNDNEAMKVIVLMTDGEHFAEERLNDAYKTGNSPIYRADPTFNGLNDTNYSVFQASLVNNSSPANICNSRPYYVPHLNQWHSRPWNGVAPNGADCYVSNAPLVGAIQQTWVQVWANLRVTYVAWQFYARALSSNAAYTAAMSNFKTMTPTATMDTQLQVVCNQAKENNVIVYGIAFEAPTNGQTQIRNCSTDAETGSHYFNAAGMQISSAFKAIANNISQLRLTQ